MIKVYVLPNCQRCEELKMYMKKNNLVYKELNVEKNPKALAKITMEGIEQYPVIEIDGKLYSDDVSRLKKIVSVY
ncbi:MAG: glutaredoxin family protein [Clostridia bacterium]|nr:glutaredoxin family protein [Clostridia bacterium]